VSPELISLLKSKFCIVFAGNIGRAQSVETLVETAQLLKDLSDVRIVIVGTGSMLGWLRQRKIDHGLDNVVLAERAPMSAMPEIYCHAAGLAVTLKTDEILSFTIPSKVQAYLAAGKPIVAAVDGESARVIAEAGAGFVSPSEDSFGLANSIRSLYGMTESARNEMGAAGRRYFLEHFEVTKQARRLVELLEHLIAGTEKN
jgi:glycosyltransferase involved in cell wall biosynthesis